MSRFSNKYNKTRKFNVDTQGFEYESLADLFNKFGAEKVYPLTAIFINTKSKYGKAPVFATDLFFVNAPQHMLETANDILRDDEAINDINNGKVGFKIYPYTAEKFNCDTFGISFVDID